MAPLLPFLALFLSAVQAAVPQDLQARAACNRDNCFRDVFGTVTPGRSAQGAKDCTSYLQKTVQPCPVTQSTTVTITKVGTIVSTTSTVSSTLATVTQTATQTSVIVSSTTPASTITTTSLATETVTQTVTSTSYTYTQLAKRDLLEARTITASCPVTTPASGTVPAYASDCTASRFSSVCSCNGNVPTAKTLQPSTVTATSTSTSFTTSTSVLYTTTLITPTNVVTTTLIQTTIYTAPVSLTTTTLSSTSTSTVTITTTVTSGTLVPTCNPTDAAKAYTEPACHANVDSCYIGVQSGNPVYGNGQRCPRSASASNPACSTDADCNTGTVTGYVCVYTASSFFCQGGTVCLKKDTNCPANQ